VSSALMLGALAISPSVSAQATQSDAETKAEDVEEVVVTGLRRSLESAQEIKKSAEVFVDSITSEDIGALPDRSVTEALQRIPGVAISRFAAGNDPDHFSIEGSGVVVRGLPQVRSELNGRDTFSANSGRFLSFSDVPPELLGGVDVYKNQSAEMIEGGLAGSVNLRTLVPFDVEGQRIAASLEANYGDFAEKTTPTGSALYTNRWEVGDGEIGFLVSGAYSELKSRSDGLQISSFQLQARDNLFGADTPVWVPEGAAFRSQDYDRERIGLAAAFQWQNSDSSKVLTVQGLRSDATTKWTETGSEIATDLDGGNGNINFALVDGYDAGYNEETGLFTHGVITSDAGWKEDQRHDGWGDAWGPQARDGRSPLWGLPSNNLLRGVNQEYMTQDVGANFKWKLNDKWGLNFDAQHVESTVTNLDLSMWTANFQNVDIDLRGDLPKVRFLSPLEDENGNTLGTCPPGPVDFASGCTPYMSAANPNLYDPFNNYWRAAMDHGEDSEGEENALKFDIDRIFENAGIAKAVKFGGRWSKREQDIRSTTWNWGALAETWGGRGPVWLNDPVDGIPTTDPAFVAGDNPQGYTGLPGTNGIITADHSYVDRFDNFFRGKVPVPSAMRLYNGSITSQAGYDAVADLAEMIGEEWRPYTNADGVPAQHWVRLSSRPGTVNGSMFLPNEIHTTEETVKSLYAMLKFGSDEGADGVTFSGNVGVRWVRTDFLSLGTVNAPTTPFQTEAQCTPPDVPDPGAPPFVPPAFCEAFPTQAERDAVRPFANGATAEFNADTDYDMFLPSFNLKVNFTDDFLMRFGFSKAMARPDLGLTRNFFNVAAATDFQNPNDPSLTNWWGLRASTGNGFLKPVRSTQFDLSAEWYFSSVGQLTATVFHKELKDVFTNGYYTTDFTNNGVTLPVVVAAPINSDEKGKMKGFEIAYQQFYDMLPGFWSGFGIQANYTYIDSQGVPQSILDPSGTGGTANNVPNVDTSFLPLVNLSKDNVNFQLMYAKGPVDARLAYSWRSDYLLTVRDVITPFSPIMNEASGQLDASFMYSINDNLKIGFQAVNLTDEIVKTSQVLQADEDGILTGPRSWFLSDRRVSAIFRMTF
jgi:TonB-dependent receptor